MARHVVAVLGKSASCQCGCTGWCTSHAIFEWLAWSLRSLAAGTWPAQRHDGAPWQVGDEEWAQRSLAPFTSKAVVCHLRGASCVDEVPDTGSGVATTFVATFWQRTMETMARHRNPIIAPGLVLLEIFVHRRVPCCAPGRVEEIRGFRL